MANARPQLQMKTPTGKEVDCVASLVEACGELEREPFFGKDDPLTGKNDGVRHTYIMGDRFHFRSALISFRRMWMSTEASYWETVIKIIRQTCPIHIADQANHIAKEIAAGCSGDAYPAKQTAKKVINLWLNTVFAHSGLDGVKKARTRRKDFEAAVHVYGQAGYEYAFRGGVKRVGKQFIMLSHLAAKPALAHFKASNGLEASFKIGAAFGVKRRERTCQGQVIIRQGSSEFFTEETMEARFGRVLARREHEDLKFVFDHLETTGAALLRQILRFRSLREVLDAIDGTLRIVPMATDEFSEAPGLRGSAGLAGKRVNIFTNTLVETHAPGELVLNGALAAFRRELIEE